MNKAECPTQWYPLWGGRQTGSENAVVQDPSAHCWSTKLLAKDRCEVMQLVFHGMLMA
jgi:hypothetical protein